MDPDESELSESGYSRTELARSEVEYTRARLDRTIDLLEEKLTPRELVLEGMRWLRTHKVQAGMLVLGVGLLMGARLKARSKRLEAGEELPKLRERFAPVAHALLVGARHLAERLAERRV